jgi:hypothetical protein
MSMNSAAISNDEKRAHHVLDGYMSEAALAAELGRTVRTLQAWRKDQKGPPWTQVGWTVLYAETSVRRWLKQQERHPARSSRTQAA